MIWTTWPIDILMFGMSLDKAMLSNFQSTMVTKGGSSKLATTECTPENHWTESKVDSKFSDAGNMRLLVQDLQIFGHAIPLPATSGICHPMLPWCLDQVTLINKTKPLQKGWYSCLKKQQKKNTVWMPPNPSFLQFQVYESPPGISIIHGISPFQGQQIMRSLRGTSHLPKAWTRDVAPWGRGIGRQINHQPLGISGTMFNSSSTKFGVYCIQHPSSRVWTGEEF